MSAIAKPSRILWLQVWSLATVQGAIALTWVIYNLYLPKLLAQMGFPIALTVTLLVIENLLSAVTEPVMGTLSDQKQQWVGSRLPFIAAGVVASSALFIAVPAVVVFGVGQILLPILAVAWALAMTLFRSPALSLLGRYAFGSGLPKAASILTLVGALAGALAPLANEMILQWGAIAAFSIGSVVLLIAAATLRQTDSQLADSQLADSQLSESTDRLQPLSSVQLSWVQLAWVFAAGMFVSIGFRLMMQVLPAVLKTQPDANVSLIMGLVFVSVAITAIPAGSLAVRLGNAKAMQLGLGVMAGALLLVLGARQPAVSGLLAIVLGAAFSLVSNGTIPFALAQVPPAKAGLGTGMYFSGGAIGASAFFSLFSQIAPSVGAVVGAAAFGLAAVSVALGDRLRASRSVL
jgi:Na+/melibiose symporter-like transporter